MLLALKIDVDSLAAAREGVPRLEALLKSLGANATFFFDMGPDRSGRTGGPLFGVGQHRPQQRLNRQLGGPHGMARFYGNLWPAPLQAPRQAKTMLQLAEQGHEVGLSVWDRVAWVKQIASADSRWTVQQIELARTAFHAVQGRDVTAMAAPMWRTNRASLRRQQQLGLAYGSDCRGDYPFLPVVDGEPIAIPQLPTTLPTLAELIGADGITEADACDAMLARASRRPLQIMTISASSDTGKRLPLLQAILAAWQARGYRLVSLGEMRAALHGPDLPWHRLEQTEWPGYAGTLAVQGDRFPR
jgi:peptidoglycan/xylan/chitin deacetylase (PgdA/CDA1 family)